MGAGFDECPVPPGEGGADRRVEADGLAQVAVPVVGGELGGVQEHAGDGGVEGDGGGAGCDVRQQTENFFPDVFDLGGVGGVVDRNLPGRDVLRCVSVQNVVECVRVARNNSGVGSVDCGDVDPVTVDPVTQPRELLRHRGRGQRNGDHATVASQFSERMAAQRHDFGGVLQGERTGYVSGRDFPLGMADDGVGVDAQGLPEAGKRNHDCEQRGLHDVDALQRGGVGVAAQHVDQGPVHERRQRVRARCQLLGEYRGGAQQLHGHPGPLRALTGEDEHGLPGVAGHALDEAGGLFSPAQRL